MPEDTTESQRNIRYFMNSTRNRPVLCLVKSVDGFSDEPVESGHWFPLRTLERASEQWNRCNVSTIDLPNNDSLCTP